YAILSHTWGPSHTEVTYRDIVGGTERTRTGYTKVQACGRQAASHNLRYLWVDTCCIDITNNAELSKAISTMFRWYRQSEVCYSFLAD
ncbi:heterokaryon incompatibility, partial [Boeremia exigua]|uniref:heterokaryon incompatibility n=1 Tax=Boeremia exigua TaxID=749465 RepID=UPI001E8DDC89